VLWAAKEAATKICQPTTRREAISQLINRIHVSETEIVLEAELRSFAPDEARPQGHPAHRLNIPIALDRRSGETAVVVAGAPNHETKHDSTLIRTVARGFTWFEELTMGQVTTVKAIAKRACVTDRYVSQLIELAFLSPKIVEKALHGSTDVGLTTKNLVFDVELSSNWSTQEREVLGRRYAQFAPADASLRTPQSRAIPRGHRGIV
jgi:hypothetical protein